MAFDEPLTTAMSAHPASSLQAQMSILRKSGLPPHSSHPSFGHLVLLVFEAVLEVVCVSLPGYIVARQGMFDAEMQKFVANLNVMLFTPCLSMSSSSFSWDLFADHDHNPVFTKLASQLTADKLGELAVIPIIFTVQTLVSYLCSIGVSRLLGLKKRPRNFVVAMGVRCHHPAETNQGCAKLAIGFWQLKFPTDLISHSFVADSQGFALGQSTR